MNSVDNSINAAAFQIFDLSLFLLCLQHVSPNFFRILPIFPNFEEYGRIANMRFFKPLIFRTLGWGCRYGSPLGHVSLSLSLNARRW
jgi:hypothetical protein